MSRNPQQRTVVVIGAHHSDARGDPETALQRAATCATVSAAINASRMAPLAEDRHDTQLLVFDATAVDVVDAFVPAVVRALRHVNGADDYASLGTVRLRLAVHHGLVIPDDTGHSGSTVTHALAVYEAAAVTETLRRAEHGQIVVAVSDRVYEDVVRHEFGAIDARVYGRIDIAVGRVSACRAWVHVPGYPVPPVPAPPAAEPKPEPSAPSPRIGQVFIGSRAEGTFYGGDRIERP